jgi:hypothetical protein
MSDEVYKKLCEEMGRRRGRFPGKNIPEFSNSNSRTGSSQKRTAGLSASSMLIKRLLTG